MEKKSEGVVRAACSTSAGERESALFLSFLKGWAVGTFFAFCHCSSYKPTTNLPFPTLVIYML